MAVSHRDSPLQAANATASIQQQPAPSQGSAAYPAIPDTDSNSTDVYTLSVVRLADPQHAHLALINITESTQLQYALCADDPSMPSAPVIGTDGAVLEEEQGAHTLV